MRKNWYALLLLILLAVTVGGAQWYVAASTEDISARLLAAHTQCLENDHTGGRESYRAIAELYARKTPVLRCLVRRSLLDKVNETLSTLPSYATPDNPADLAVETSRALEQLDQLKESFIAVF